MTQDQSATPSTNPTSSDVDILNSFASHCDWALGENTEEIRKRLTNGYEWPDLDHLRAEACFCLLMNLRQSALAITCVLLESALRLSIAYRCSKMGESKDSTVESLLTALKPGVEKVSNQTMWNLIEIAKSLQLISQVNADQLFDACKSIRNGFLHADIRKLFGDQTIPVMGFSFDSFTSDELDAPIFALPILHGEAMKSVAGNHATGFFLFVDDFIRDVRHVVFPSAFQNSGSRYK